MYKSITIEDHLVLKAMVTIKGNDDQEDKHCNNMKALVGIQMQWSLLKIEIADDIECC